MKNYAYVSLIATDDYLGAAITMMEAWKNLKSIYPFYLMVTENISPEVREIVAALGYKLIDINEWRPTDYDKTKNNITDESILKWHGATAQEKGWQHAFSKIRVWSLVQFDKVCWVDLDILFFKNIDDVFDLVAPAWLGHDINGFSASQIFMIEPNLTIFNKLVEHGNNFESNPRRKQNKDVLFTDEPVLHTFFEHDVKYNATIPLTYSYNWNRCSSDYTFVQDSFDLRGVHMTGTEKPWLMSKSFVDNFGPQWYAARYIWYHYINLYNLGAKKLIEKGYNVKLIEN